MLICVGKCLCFLGVFSGSGPGSASVSLAVGGVPLPTASRFLSRGSKGGRNVFGGTPNTATGTVALPNPCGLVDGSRDHVEECLF
jgi:hypothetical protein